MSARVAVLLALAATGCTDYLTGSFRTNEFSGDPYPINVETSSGAIVVGLVESNRTGTRNAVLDVLSPVTVIDRGADEPPSIGDTTLTLLGATVPGGPLDQPRARFSDREVVTLHPCDRGTPICEVGTPATPRPFDALVGMDTFSGDALRIRMSTSEIFVVPDIAGDDPERSRACDAVFPSPFRGGGTLILGGTEVGFTNRRIAIDTCIAPNPARDIPQRERGIDALFVLSTAVGISMINESTYARYRELFPTEPALETLPIESVNLPSGPVEGRRTSLPSLALVGNLSSGPRAPCRQVYAHHLLTQRRCLEDDDCPCTGSEDFCAVPAVIELGPPSRIDVLVIADNNSTLLALRTELRPDRPEVDGILGTDALLALELDIDYPNGRVLGRCIDRQACGARVTLSHTDDRAYVNGCLGDMPGPIR